MNIEAINNKDPKKGIEDKELRRKQHSNITTSIYSALNRNKQRFSTNKVMLKIAFKQF